MDKLERKLERARSGESSGRASNALATFELTRPIVGASALGIAQAAYEWTLEYLDDSVHYVDPFESVLDESSTAGRPPLERQGIQQVLARRRDRDRGRAPARPARLLDGPQRHPDDRRPGLDVEAEGRATSRCGRPAPDGPGRPRTRSRRDCPLEKWFRDAKIYQLFEGTAEIQRLVISRMQAAEYRERLSDRGRDRAPSAVKDRSVAVPA